MTLFMFMLLVEEERVVIVFSGSMISRDDICCRFYKFGKGCWKTGLSAGGGGVWRCCWRGCRLRFKIVLGWNARCLKDQSSSL